MEVLERKKERTQISVSNSGGLCVVKQKPERTRTRRYAKRVNSTLAVTAQHANQLVSICVAAVVAVVAIANAGSLPLPAG